MSKIEVDTIEPQSGTSLTLGASGDTITIPSGATLTNSGTATGFGKVLQVVQTTVASSLTTTSASFVTLNLAATITPSSASNKILMLFSTGAHNNNGANGCVFTIYRGSIATGTNLGDSNWGFGNFDSVGDGILSSFSIVHLDSPNTTSATTYTPAGKANAGVTLVTSFGNSRGSFILIEIEG